MPLTLTLHGSPAPLWMGMGGVRLPTCLPIYLTVTHMSKVALIKSAASRTIKINTDGPPIPTIPSKTGDGRSSCRGGLWRQWLQKNRVEVIGIVAPRIIINSLYVAKFVIVLQD